MDAPTSSPSTEKAVRAEETAGNAAISKTETQARRVPIVRLSFYRAFSLRHQGAPLGATSRESFLVVA